MPDSSDAAASRLLAATFGLVVAFLLYYFADYGHWLIHPHQFVDQLRFLLDGGPEPLFRSFLNVFQRIDPIDHRPRFLSYAIVWADLQLRMRLYEWLVLYPPFSIAWIFELLLGPLLLFRLVRNLSGDAAPAWVALIVYVTSIGFLSGFAVSFTPGKPLTPVVFIVTLWALGEAKRRAQPGQMLHEVRGARSLMTLLGAALVCGLFLDEAPLFAFVLPLLFYPELFLPAGRGTREIRRAAKSWLPLAIPPLLFLYLVVIGAPLLTQKLFGYRFDYIGSVFVNRDAAQLGKTFFSDGAYGFGWESLCANFFSLFGSALVPWQAGSLLRHPSGHGIITGLSTVAPLVGATLAALLGCAFLGLRGRKPAALYLKRTLVAALLFVLFVSALSGRHLPFITGYFYGCGFALFPALMAGFAYGAAASAAARRFVALVALLAAGAQFVNFHAINDSWITVHNEAWVRPSYEKSLPIAPEERTATREELNAIWSAWKANRLDEYLAHNPISPGAVFLMFELSYLKKWRPPAQH
jgi:hypothetical protein